MLNNGPAHMEEYIVNNIGDLTQAIHGQQNQPDTYLGEILTKASLINKVQLQQALKRQEEDGKHLGRIMLEMGMVTPQQINYALAYKFGIPFVKLSSVNISQSVLTKIPGELAVQYNVVPLGEINGKLIIAMENPLDSNIIEALRFNTRQKIDAVMASTDDITKTLQHYYSQYEEIRAISDVDIPSIQRDESIKAIEQQAQKKPIVRLLNAIILQGVVRGASDIHICPGKDHVDVYYRVDGKFQNSRTINHSILPALVSRIKIIGQMDISERRMPQDGHARLNRGKRVVDMRLSVIPTINGESVVIRILDKEMSLKPLDKLGLLPQQLEKITNIASHNHGLFLVTGPTGSGKSTTMYAVLAEVMKRNPHVLTVEDPVEYDVDGIEQVQVNEAIGLTFSKVLRYFLRHDPDVILVGEIRDNETAEIANKAALTGHLVFSTLHTNDAPSTITRLLDMNIEPFLLSSTLRGVMAQRLVRLNCQHCLEKEVVKKEVREMLRISKRLGFYRGSGCPSCNYTGYSGRVSVCELLEITPEIRELINAEASQTEITKVAVSQGMVRLMESALLLAKQKKTSFEEVYSVRMG